MIYEYDVGEPTSSGDRAGKANRVWCMRARSCEGVHSQNTVEIAFGNVCCDTETQLRHESEA